MAVNETDYPVLEQIQDRWSPYRFDAREVEEEKLLLCLEAARWAASSFNDQPWSWIVARRQNTEEFEQMVGCLMEANQPWASQAGVLVMTVSRNHFAYNKKPNRVALHDLGQAAAHLALQATSVGLQVHQMGGVNLSKVRLEYGIPEGYEPQTAIAIGYADSSDPSGELATQLHKRESGPRTRLKLSEQVFSGKWGKEADFVQ